MNYIRFAHTLIFILTTVIAGTSCGHGEDHQTATVGDFSAPQSRVPGEYLVTLSAGVEVEVITNLYGQFGIQTMKNAGNNVFLVTFSSDPGLARMEELRAQEPRIEAVQSNLVYRTQPKLEPGTDY